MTQHLALSIFVYTAILWLLTTGGNWVCRGILALTQVVPTPQQSPPAAGAAPGTPTAIAESNPRLRAGRMIGRLERILIMLGLASNSWEVLIAVIALKTVARYNELDKQIAAEYFLIGSLTSILWAILITAIGLQYDSHCGLHLAQALRTLTR